MTNTDPKIPALLQTKREISEGLAIFRFELARELHFKPGQHATLWLTHHGKGIARPYSIASSPSETRTLEFYINLVEQGRLTHSMWNPEIIRGLSERDPHTRLEITGPKGRFLLDPEDRRDLMFVASGTGLAPFMSMIRKLNEDYLSSPQTHAFRSIFVVHGASYSKNLGYREELENLAHETGRNPQRKLTLAYIPTISRPRMDRSWTGLKGRVETLFEDEAGEAANSPDLQSVIKSMLRAMLRPESLAVYVCGHPGTVDNMQRLLALRGFRPDLDLKREKYYR